MCGFVGFIDHQRRWGVPDLASLIDFMTDCIRHRGPDDGAHWLSPEDGVALGFRRLAILDLSPTGRQPMVSESGNQVLVCNGEIYNFQELRQRLEPHPWRGTSDTEVLLAAFEAWGPERTLQAANGMFALALWNVQNKTLLLARDRFGEKPLYYGRGGPSLLFASELKALQGHPDFDAQVDRGALSLLLRQQCIPAPWSIFAGIRKLPAASYLMVKGDGTYGDPVPYWSVVEAAAAAQFQQFVGSAEEATDCVDAALRRAVACRMVADVPVGALLSGGIDSSTVVALMQAQSSTPVRTFSIGFEAQSFNEAGYAKRVAQHLGTQHVELYVTPAMAMEVIPRLPMLYDEPFADSSQLPTFLVCQLARQHVTVALSGDGGDELFGGYNRHTIARRYWKRTQWMPAGLRTVVAGVARRVAPEVWGALLSRALPQLSPSQPGNQLKKVASLLACSTPHALYLRLVACPEGPAQAALGAPDLPTAASLARIEGYPAAEQMMLLDALMYLPDDILAKVDRASMGVSLEVRVPFLDPEVFTAAWRMPEAFRFHGTQGKWLLRQVLHRYVPRELVERPKMGFGVPVHLWVRDELRDWAQDLLDPVRLRQDGWLDEAAVSQHWQEHLQGHYSNSYFLWSVLMFQQWWSLRSSVPRWRPSEAPAGT